MIARRLSPGSALVYRHFGATDRRRMASALARIFRRRGALLVVGADPRLAVRVKAAGVHFPERMIRAARVWRRRRPEWLITVAAHSPAAVRRAAFANGVVISPIFPSRSASAGPAIGLAAASVWARPVRGKAVALGGVTPSRFRLLSQKGFVAAAGVDLFNPPT